jgi:hypothetical protein
MEARIGHQTYISSVTEGAESMQNKTCESGLRNGKNSVRIDRF